MPIASLVVTVDARTSLREAALAHMIHDVRMQLGPARGNYLPLVVDTESAQEGEDLVAELLRQPGVIGVDVVGIDFSLDGDK